MKHCDTVTTVVVAVDNLFHGDNGGDADADKQTQVLSRRNSLFPTVRSHRERDIERSELKLLQRQEDTHRNKVCKFKLHYSNKFRVLRSTKISNTFLYNSKPRDVIEAWAACAETRNSSA